MRFEFKQAVHILGKNFPCGAHEVSKEIQEHSFFKKLLKHGLIKPYEEKKLKKSSPKTVESLVPSLVEAPQEVKEVSETSEEIIGGSKNESAPQDNPKRGRPLKGKDK